ncbi:sulfite exporter TauE/SafE family protein [Candidatus Wolfebacteria bacterium]|nr:sulfite exporter TauE/SafE family protein [Candidatus Wolfebacteria bacterium]
MIESLIIPVFIAGILTFLAPCTLPLVPGYLGFISGISSADLENPEKTKQTRKKIFLNGFFFIIGFTLIFILLGTTAGILGSVLRPYRLWLTRLGGVFVILFGLFMLNILKIPLFDQERQFRVPQIFERGRSLNSLLLGSAFGLGWTPCVGPILGTVLTLTAASATASQGAFLLGIFSLGLAVPFLLIAVGIGSAALYIQKISRYLNWVSIVGGAFLVFLGILLLTNSLGIWVSYFYQVFNFINYDRLINYL